MRKAPSGHGFQYEVRLIGSDETQWEAASRLRRQIPELVAAFEEMQRQPSNTTDGEGNQQYAGESEHPLAQALAEELNEQRAHMEEQGLVIAELREQMKQQKQQLDQQSRAMGSGKQSPTPGASPKHSPQHLHATSSRFAKKEPRSQDLKEYDGSAGTKLDEWPEELGLAVDLYELNSHESIRFGASRLRGAALQWWRAMGKSDQAAITTVDLLAKALRSRFQPITSAHIAREKLLSLSQGARHVNEYIAEFQRLHTQLPYMAMEDALFLFERGLRTDIAEKLRIQGVSNLVDATALAARVGALTSSSTSSMARSGSSVTSRLHQMDIEDGESSQSDRRLERMEAALNALQQNSNPSTGLGAKTQAKRGCAKQRQQQGQSRLPPQIQIPGVPEEVLQQRWAAKLCLRCGQEGHRSMACPNHISSQPSSSN